MFSASNPASAGPHLVLSSREIQFLNLVCTDLTYQQIADQLDVSPRTVDGYREGLFEKLSLKSRVALALWAVNVGVVVL